MRIIQAQGLSIDSSSTLSYVTLNKHYQSLFLYHYYKLVNIYLSYTLVGSSTGTRKFRFISHSYAHPSYLNYIYTIVFCRFKPYIKFVKRSNKCISRKITTLCTIIRNFSDQLWLLKCAIYGAN